MQSPPPYCSRLSQDQADSLYRSGKTATLVLIDVPAGTCFGLDRATFLTGEKFQGVKLIWPGVHFVSTRSIARRHQDQGSTSPSFDYGGESAGPLIGKFLWMDPGDVVVRRWNADLECLEDVNQDEDDNDHDLFNQTLYALRSHRLDSGLAPYDYSGHAEWVELTQCITKNTIDRISPLNGGEICVAWEEDTLKSGTSGGGDQLSAAEESLNRQLEQAYRSERGEPTGHVPDHNDDHHDNSQDAIATRSGGVDRSTNAQCFYVSIPSRVVGKGMSPAALTAANVDKSDLMEALLREEWGRDPREILGELQFSFIAFLFGQSLQGFLQWKSLILLLSNCERAADEDRNAELFRKGIKTMEAQVLFLSHDKQTSADDPHTFALTLASDIRMDGSAPCFLRGSLAPFLGSLRRTCQVDDVRRQANESFEKLRTIIMDSTKLASASSDYPSMNSAQEFIECEFEEGEDAPVVVDLGQDHEQ